jgi:hypothetical protein
LTGSLSPIGKLRNLDGLEKAFWLLDQNFNTHFSVVADVRGSTMVEDWATALHEAGHQSDMVACQIQTGPDGVPFFVKGPSRALPLTVVDGEQEQWTAHVEAEQADAFDVANDPLARARLLHGPDRSVLILTFHHTIADGVSSGYFLQEVLRGASGAQVNLPAGSTSLEDALDRRELHLPPPIERPAETGAMLSPPHYRPRHLLQPTVRAQALSPTLTRSLRARARAEGSTVHGALSAATSIAFSQGHPTHPAFPPRVFTPIDPRQRLLGSPQYLCVHVAGMTARAPDTDASFWECARVFSQAVAAATAPPALAQSIKAVRSILAEVTSVDIAAAIWAQAFGAEILLTNLANADIALNYGSLRLAHYWGPAVSIGLSAEQSLGVVTLGGTMHFVHTSYQPINGFLESIVAALEAAGSMP